MLLNQVEAFCKQQQLLNPSSVLIVGLSGGPDSVCLLHILNRLREQYFFTLRAAHLNHGWRSSANNDADFCAALCSRLNIPLDSVHAQQLDIQIKKRGSLEDEGRQFRQKFFKDLAARHNARIMLAHHLNDQHETFFMRLTRGSSLTGLAGMRECEGNIIRPLLYVSKQDILAYLVEHKQDYCHDETNDNEQFLRNRIRHQLMPSWYAIDARASAMLTNSMEQLRQADDFVNAYVNELLPMICEQGSHGLLLRKDALLSLHPYLQRRVLLAWMVHEQVELTISNAWFNEIMRFINEGRSTCHTVHPAWRLRRHHGLLFIERKEHAQSNELAVTP